MTTGAGKTFTAITAAYRPLKLKKMNHILFLVDTRSLGKQGKREFLAYIPTMTPDRFLTSMVFTVLPNARQYANLHQYHSADVFHFEGRGSGRVCGGDPIQRVCDRRQQSAEGSDLLNKMCRISSHLLGVPH